MRIAPFVVALFPSFIACGNSTTPRGTAGTAPPGVGGQLAGATAGSAKGDLKAPDGEDWSKQVAEMNSDKYGRPPRDFRRGHVSKREAPRATKTANGWSVKFAASAALTTPAVYEGMVYTSGGFNSKEFYAFDMHTGAAKWAIDLDDDGPSTAACENRVCVFNTESCTIFAVDSHTGEELWSWWLGDPLTSAPTIAHGLVFTSYPAASVHGDKPRPPGATHALAAFDLKTGAIKWQMWLDSDVMSAPVVAGEFLYVSTFAGTVMKLEPKTGNLRYAVKSRATSAPVVTWEGGRESMYYTRRSYDFDDETVNGAQEMIIRADDNHPKTKFTAKKKAATYIDEKKQGASGHAAKGKAEDSGNGFGGGAPAAANAEAALSNVGVGSVSTMQTYQGSRILHLGKTMVNTMGDEIVATSSESGDELWTLKLDGDTARDGGHLGTAPLAAGGRVLVATIKGEVLELDPAKGKIAKRHTVGAAVRSQPVVDRGWIFVGTDDGRLVAIDTRDRTLTGWPMWGGNAARTGAVPVK
jgi:outer membrane protein assembly factor BamB